MNHFHSLNDPFGGAGVPGDSMEHVLSLQSYDPASEVIIVCSTTCACNTNGCVTKSCTFSCAGTALEGGTPDNPYAW